jgi:toxin secretion/phage lysis holin
MRALAVLVAGAAVLDYLTGVLAAAKGGRIDSAVGMKGLYKKLALFCALALGFFLDAAIPLLAERGLSKELDVKLPFGLILAAWIVLNESVSVLENLSRCGVRLPELLVRTLKVASKKIDGGQEETKP